MARTKRNSSSSPSIPSNLEEINDTADPVQCPECGRRFPSVKALCGHMRSHPDRTRRGMIRMNPPLPDQNKQGGGEKDDELPLSNESFTSLVSLLTSATSLSLRFLSDSDLLLLPSQSLSLSSSLRSSSLSLSRLISHLPTSVTLPPPPPPPPPPPQFYWFRRFLSSSSADLWLSHFRMSKPSFYLLLQTLSPSLAAPSSSPLPADHKLASALFRLAHAAPFSDIARRFNFSSPALACRAFYESCKAAADRLAHLFELSSDSDRVVQGFNWMTLPSCCGVIAYSRFNNSIVAQCVVDSECRFLDVSAGWPASMPPADILARTKLYSSRPVVLTTEGRYFLSGPQCPLLPWLLTPFTNPDNPKEAAFNTVHRRGMELAERAFGRVRARWQLLRAEWGEECAESLPYVVVAACLLHNYLIKCSEPAPTEAEMAAGGECCSSGFAEFGGAVDEGGERVRDVLASCMSQVICK